MNDYYALVRYRQDHQQAERQARNFELAREVLGNKKARPQWPRFDLPAFIRRLLPKAGGLPQPTPPCSESPVSAR